MERRDFMKMCSVAGIGLVGSSLLTDNQAAEAAQPEANAFFTFNQTGGWDTTAWLEPIGNVGATPTRDGAVQPNSYGDIINDYYAPTDIRMAGNIPYAPPDFANALTLAGVGIPEYMTTFGQTLTAQETAIDLLMKVLADRMLILRGIDQQTNGHDTGQRNTMSGRMAEGQPALAALYAAALGKALPLAFITNGGYDETAGVAPKVRLNNTDAFQALIYPNRIDPDSADSQLYHTEETMQRISAMRQERLDRMQRAQNLPMIKNRQSLLFLARSGVGNLKLINDYLPATPSNGNLQRQVDIALAAYLAGLSVSVTISRGGFDTHGDNTTQYPNQEDVATGILHLFHRAMQLEAQTGFQIVDKLFVMVGSDFSRSALNPQGKDHWAETSMMFMGPGIAGNRVIGGSDDGQRYLKVDPATNQLSDAGAPITQANVHKWMRGKLGIEENEDVRRFPLNPEADFNFDM
jgi:hypothetical protein